MGCAVRGCRRTAHLVDVMLLDQLVAQVCVQHGSEVGVMSSIAGEAWVDLVPGRGEGWKLIVPLDNKPVELVAP